MSKIMFFLQIRYFFKNRTPPINNKYGDVGAINISPRGYLSVSSVSALTWFNIYRYNYC
jgi:hypothetical protein